MLILVLIDVQYSQKAVFSFEKDSNCQNHSSSGSLHPAKKFPLVKFLILPPSLIGGELTPHSSPYHYLENPDMWCHSQQWASIGKWTTIKLFQNKILIHQIYIILHSVKQDWLIWGWSVCVPGTEIQDNEAMFLFFANFSQFQ